MNYSPEERARRAAAMRSRYEVGDGREVEGFAGRFADAAARALRIGDGASVYDRLAHAGRVELWRVTDQRLHPSGVRAMQQERGER